MADQYTCAVWYDRYGHARYELCDDEDEAVSFAYVTGEAGEGHVLGVQFADGRVVKRGDWPALRDYEQERDNAVPATPPQPRPTRQVRHPFGSDFVTVDAETPAWLGASS